MDYTKARKSPSKEGVDKERRIMHALMVSNSENVVPSSDIAYHAACLQDISQDKAISRVVVRELAKIVNKEYEDTTLDPFGFSGIAKDPVYKYGEYQEDEAREAFLALGLLSWSFDDYLHMPHNDLCNTLIRSTVKGAVTANGGSYYDLDVGDIHFNDLRFGKSCSYDEFLFAEPYSDYLTLAGPSMLSRDLRHCVAPYTYESTGRREALEFIAHSMRGITSIQSLRRYFSSHYWSNAIAAHRDEETDFSERKHFSKAWNRRISLRNVNYGDDGTRIVDALGRVVTVKDWVGFAKAHGPACYSGASMRVSVSQGKSYKDAYEKWDGSNHVDWRNRKLLINRDNAPRRHGIETDDLCCIDRSFETIKIPRPIRERRFIDFSSPLQQARAAKMLGLHLDKLKERLEAGSTPWEEVAISDIFGVNDYELFKPKSPHHGLQNAQAMMSYGELVL